MEKPKREKANVLKNAAMAGLVFLAGGKVEAQDFGNWRRITPEEYTRLKTETPDSLIQNVRARQGVVPTDETKDLRTFTDNRNTYYWKNDRPKTREEVLANTLQEESLRSGQPKITHVIRKGPIIETKPAPPKEEPPTEVPADAPPATATTNTEAKPSQEIPPEINTGSSTEKTGNLDSGALAEAPEENMPNVEEKPNVEGVPPEITEVPPVEKEDPAEKEMDKVVEGLGEYANRFKIKEAHAKNPEDEKTLSGALVIHDTKTDKEYLALRRKKNTLTDDIFYFAEALRNSGIRGGCLELLKRQGKLDLPVEEKIKYLQEFLTTQIENLDKYKAPKLRS